MMTTLYKRNIISANHTFDSFQNINTHTFQIRSNINRNFKISFDVEKKFNKE